MKKLIAISALLLMSASAQAEKEHDQVCNMMLDMVPKLYYLWASEVVQPDELARALLNAPEAMTLTTESKQGILGFVQTTYVGYHSGWSKDLTQIKMQEVCDEIKGL